MHFNQESNAFMSWQQVSLLPSVTVHDISKDQSLYADTIAPYSDCVRELVYMYKKSVRE